MVITMVYPGKRRLHCTMYTLHYTLYTVHCTLYSVQCTLYEFTHARFFLHYLDRDINLILAKYNQSDLMMTSSEHDPKGYPALPAQYNTHRTTVYSGININI